MELERRSFHMKRDCLIIDHPVRQLVVGAQGRDLAHRVQFLAHRVQILAHRVQILAHRVVLWRDDAPRRQVERVPPVCLAADRQPFGHSPTLKGGLSR